MTTSMPLGPVLRHRAVLCSSDEQTVDEATWWLADALRRGRDPVVAALAPPVRQGVEDGFPDAASVVFLDGGGDLAGVGGNAVQDYLRRLSERPARPAVMVDATLYPRDPDATIRLEAEVEAERALAHHDWEHTCLYPRGGAVEGVARLTHRLLGSRGQDRASGAHRGPAELVATHPVLAHVDPDAVVRDVVPHVDPDLRGWIAARADAIGLPAPVREQVVLAVHEATRTAAESTTGLAGSPVGSLGSGLPTARLYLRTAAERYTGHCGLVCDVDAARLPALPDHGLPEEPILKALWLADVGCPDVTVSVHPSRPGRSRIRVVTRRPGASEGRGLS